MELVGTIEWKLTKNQVETEMGKKITDEEFDLFAKHFKNNFEAQYEGTLEFQASNWESVKTWKLF